MAHQQQIIEMDASDEEEGSDTPALLQAGTRSDHPNWSLFAPPGGSRDVNGEHTLRDEGDENDSGEHLRQQPLVIQSNPNSRSMLRPRLIDVLNEAAPGPSTSRQARRIPSPATTLAPLPWQPDDDEKMRSILGLPPFGYPNQSNVDMLEDSIPTEDTFDQSCNSLSITNDMTKKQRISEYQCPICFSPPSHACLTPCGHVICAQCLFSSLRAARERHVRLYGRGAGPDGEGKVSRCPVCRAIIKGWDGKGGGVVGLKIEMKGTNERTQIVMPF